MIKSIKASTIDTIIYSLIGIFFVWNLFRLDYSSSNLWVVLSFFTVGGFSFYQIVSSEKNISLKRIFYIFFFIFMFFAPLQQYLSGTVLWKSTGAKLSYSHQEYLYANILLLLFLAFFEYSYVCFLGQAQKNRRFSRMVTNKEQSGYRLTVEFSNVISIISLFVLFLTGNIWGRNGISSISFKNLSDQIVRILRYIPISCLIFSVWLWQEKRIMFKKSIVFFVIEGIIIYFPFYGSVSRFLLFGTYLSIFTLFAYNLKDKSVYFLMFVVGFFVVFSAFNFFKTHSLVDWYKFSLEIVNFKTVDYDAYQIFMATIKYAQQEGYCYGKNIITAIGCMIPRSVWVSKMLPSGEIVLKHFDSWFTNVSCPWFAELYFAFGSIGLILGAVATGMAFKKLDGFYEDGGFFKRGFFCILTGLLIYILRGALLPAISYTVALTLSLVLVWLVNQCCFWLSKRGGWNEKN